MPVTVKGSGGGGVTLDAGAAASNTTLTLPNTTGTVALTASPTFTGTTTFPGSTTVDSSGNVGVGTTSPSTYGQFVVYNAATGAVRSVGGSVTAYMFASNSGSVAATGTETNHPFAIYTNNTERARFDTSGNFLFNSGYGSVATAYGCRAWVNFNGTGTVAIRASANVSSITDNGTGQYVVNFTTAMPDANYCATLAIQSRSGQSDVSNYLFDNITSVVNPVAPTTGGYAILCNQYDPAYVMSAVFR